MQFDEVVITPFSAAFFILFLHLAELSVPYDSSALISSLLFHAAPL